MYASVHVYTGHLVCNTVRSEPAIRLCLGNTVIPRRYGNAHVTQQYGDTYAIRLCLGNTVIPRRYDAHVTQQYDNFQEIS